MLFLENMNLQSLLKIVFNFIGTTIGICLAIALTFFTDLETLSNNKLPFLKHITDEWRLLSVLLTFTFSIYCLQMGNKELKSLVQQRPKLDWWQRGIIYQLYPRSFKDSNNDGIGDLKGIIDKLDYLESLGIEIIYLNPIYKSNGKDNGYDIISFFEFDQEYGTMHDFEYLIKEIHSRGMYLVMDFVPNHTSDKHEWFRKSCEGDELYKDYYIWVESEDSVRPPTNWITSFCKSAWTYSEQRKAWYFHTFLPHQPDLNLRNERVRQEMRKILDYWLKYRNVDGLRIDAVKHIIKSENLKDEPWRESMKGKEMTYDSLDHIYTTKQVENYALLSEWREHVDKISRELNKTKILFGESYEDSDSLALYFNYHSRAGMHFPCNFQFLGLRDTIDTNNNQTSSDKMKQSFNPSHIQMLVDGWLKNKNVKNFHSNWSLGNHDVSRIGSRIGRENIDLANALNLLIGGTPFTYYGEEIGMIDLPRDMITFETCRDEFAKSNGPDNYAKWNRDYFRSPMQWDDSPNAGFTKEHVRTWLPVNPNYKTLNVKEQLKNSFSSLKIYMRLAQLRKNASFQFGSMDYAIIDANIFSFTRKAFNQTTHLVAINCAQEDVTVDFTKCKGIPARAQVDYYFYYNQTSDRSDLQPQQIISTKQVLMNPKSCLILKWSDN